MATLTVGGGPKIADGMYAATCLHVECNPPAPHSLSGQPWLLWTYVVHDTSQEGVRLTGISSTAPGRRAKWRQWAQALLGRELMPGESIDTGSLSMKDGRVVVQYNKETGYVDIVQVLPMHGAAPQRDTPPALMLTPKDEPEDIPY